MKQPDLSACRRKLGPSVSQSVRLYVRYFTERHVLGSEAITPPMQLRNVLPVTYVVIILDVEQNKYDVMLLLAVLAACCSLIVSHFTPAASSRS